MNDLLSAEPKANDLEFIAKNNQINIEFSHTNFLRIEQRNPAEEIYVENIQNLRFMIQNITKVYMEEMKKKGVYQINESVSFGFFFESFSALLGLLTLVSY